MTEKQIKKFEKLVSDILAECAKSGEPVTREEAEEMAQMELGYKAMNHYTRTAPPKPEKQKKPRTHKVSDEKKELFNTILRNLDRADGVLKENIEVLKENKLILVTIGEKKFKIDLIEQRPAKKK